MQKSAHEVQSKTKQEKNGMLGSATSVLAHSGSFAFAIIFAEHVASRAVHVLRAPLSEVTIA